MRTRRNLLVLISILLLHGSLAAADASFTGSWKLNTERSDIRKMPHEPYSVLKIEQTGNLLHVSAQDTAKKAVEWRCTTDGKEARYKIGDESMSSILKWEGSALLINTLVNGRAVNHAEMDRWKLSRDGATLTIRRQVETPNGEAESTLVYEKQ